MLNININKYVKNTFLRTMVSTISLRFWRQLYILYCINDENRTYSKHLNK